MSESDTLNYLNLEEEDIEVEPIEGLEDAFLKGICSKCLDTGFVHTVKDGVLGVAYKEAGRDVNDKPIHQLIRCTHSFSNSY